jgi:hypothetical protein
VTTYTEYFYKIIKLVCEMIKRHQAQMMALEKRAPTGMNVTDHDHRRTDAHDVRPSHEKRLFFLANFAQEHFVE